MNAGNSALIICEATVKTTSPRIVAKMWKIENTPVNVHLSFSAKLSVMMSFAVKSAKAFVALARPSALAPPKTCLNADPIEFRILKMAWKMFPRPWTSAVRPPRSFHIWRNPFRASELDLMTLPSQSPIAVNRSEASSKSPNRISNVSAHPEPMASLVVSISWLKVRILVAASNAPWANCFSLCACSSEYPISTSWASERSFVRAVRVVVITWAVSQSSWRDSRKLPFLAIASSTPVPIIRAVSIRAFLNDSPPIPALTREFQSCRWTTPAEIAWDS